MNDKKILVLTKLDLKIKTSLCWLITQTGSRVTSQVFPNWKTPFWTGWHQFLKILKIKKMEVAWSSPISFISNTWVEHIFAQFRVKIITISCQWSFSGKKSTFLPIFGSKMPLVKNLGLAWGLPHFFYLLYISYSYFCQKLGQKPLPFPAN